ncbi:hypothetical protein GIB67_013757 [Kingdonia uniflora]|uniref:Water stress and hypersensitive response domain-containing protein n=1 Tax=Kingdonia uniflora TaxID=39325 RepID=A0A7J7MN47_9MAGN|nr:hypothetical protein GIB67_013757 [Kingdonia uniflora]
MGKKVNWASTFLGGASATAIAILLFGKPRDPTFEIVTIKSKSLKLQTLQQDLILTVHLTNPNIVPINYSSSSIDIFYHGSILGSGKVQAGSQPPKSCQLLKLQARLHGLRLANHISRFVSDVAKREMVLDATLDIKGTAKVLWWWDRKFEVHLDSCLTIDPIDLDVIEQDNRTAMKLSMFW